MRTVVVGLALVLGGSVLSANQPGASQSSAVNRPSDNKQAAEAPSTTPPAESYAYQADGRRDPFVNLIGSGSEPKTSLKHSEGTSGIPVAEVSVRGVIASKGALLAMIQSPDKKTYLVHAGDKLLDGTIKSVTPQGLVIVQDVKDPLSLVKQREVRKVLRTAVAAQQ
jgi:Tfp pilus assembly protein PilP